MIKSEKNQLRAESGFNKAKVYLKSYPIQLSVYITDTCNLKCIMCNIGQKDSPSISIKPEGYQTIFDVFPYTKLVVLTGAELFYDKGNPLGYVQKIFDEGSIYPHLKFSGLSNGTLINENRARMVVDKFAWLNVSIDTPDPEEYARIRVGSKFSLVKKNLERVRDLKEKKGLIPGDEPTIGLSFIIFNRTYRKILEMADLVLELKARRVSFQAPYDGTLQDENIFSDRDKVEEYLELMKMAINKIKGADFFVGVNDRTSNQILKYFPDMKERLNNPDQIAVGAWPNCCNAPYKEAYIKPNGDVTVCCTSNTILGNINTMSFREIWNSETTVGLRERILSGNYIDCRSNCVRGYILPKVPNINSTTNKFIKKRTSWEKCKGLLNIFHATHS